ncbi:putative formamidopyrimidine-DNA glycosylase [Venustampulla echinocandica]|uniref:Putative formamidopyrimidine-DNA glycosylase n=1 Tax=Venustampulla echinocandica TaxID=2656787 RepID=A0A370TNJ3_9HELO|nr:putative formamidopyrimidine-DNA glycosylase [Venustampulla echinocandica]RDL37090.1 putative formamidopyrimidine-DNA glycosylase [Venustampulla echinocandica]
MPEIAEVARIVHFLRKTLVGKTLSVVKAQDDPIVFGKVGTSAAEFQKALTGKKVVDANQQGKYFWLIMSSPPHPVFHFGMTGWFHIRGEKTVHYRQKEADGEQEWPPKYWKFSMETAGDPKVEAAFTDSRRLGRVRLVDCPGKDIRKTTPLKENGPDPVIDKDIFTEEWLEKKLKSKRVPIKALLLDQANISGIGNWVGDEILYNAKIHPEQYSNTFSSAQIKQLHKSIRYVCQTSVDLLGDSEKFPDDWLFNHRWGKGKKNAVTTMPNGAKITHLTVGGRTSCVVPSVQKKTGDVAGDLKNEDEEETGVKAGTKKGGKAKVAPSKKRKADPEDDEDDVVFKDEDSAEELQNGNKSGAKKAKSTPKSKTSQPKGDAAVPEGRRRSGRSAK